MRHGQKTKKLSRKKDQRKAMMQSLTEALVENGRIKTTETKAKALRPFVEKLVTKARKEDSAHVRRQLKKKLGNREYVMKKLIEEIAPRYKDRTGGYTRILKLPPRQSDGAPMALIEFV